MNEALAEVDTLFEVDDNLMFRESVNSHSVSLSSAALATHPSWTSSAGIVERGVALLAKGPRNETWHPPHVVISHSVISPVIESKEDWARRLGVQRTTGDQRQDQLYARAC
jgi:hypothetical protein